MHLYLNSLDTVVTALCAFLSCSLLTTTVFTHVFIEQINDDDDDDDIKGVSCWMKKWLTTVAGVTSHTQLLHNKLTSVQPACARACARACACVCVCRCVVVIQQQRSIKTHSRWTCTGVLPSSNGSRWRRQVGIELLLSYTHTHTHTHTTQIIQHTADCHQS